MNWLKFGAAAVGISLLGLNAPAPSRGAVLMTFDMRASAVGGGAQLIDNKDVIVSAPGQTVTVQLYAVITNNDGNPDNDGYLNSFGSIVSGTAGPGGLKGDLGSQAVSTVNSDFGFPSVPGTAQDLDGDGDADIGGLVQMNATGFINVTRSSTIFDGSPNTGPKNEYLLETAVFTATSLGSVGTSINFVPRIQTFGTLPNRQIYKFTSDGTAFSIQGTDSQIGVGQSISISVTPEPSTIALMGLAGIGLLFSQRCFFWRKRAV